MNCQHLVRVGALGQIGRFTAVDLTLYPRGARVIVRTGRGLEIGRVVASPTKDGATRDMNRGGEGRSLRESAQASAASDGSILRGMTIEDELLAARLEKNQAAAFAACQERLVETQTGAVLMDVEQLFDGQSLWFYFLGEPPPSVESMTAELAELYESKIQFRRFVESVNEGCGPGCGADSGAGCVSCATGCAVAAACATKR